MASWPSARKSGSATRSGTTWRGSTATRRTSIELFLDGSADLARCGLADGRALVNDREHDCQFSVFSRLTGYTRYGGGFNYLGWGNFFGQIGEIRISDIRRYDGRQGGR